MIVYKFFAKLIKLDNWSLFWSTSTLLLFSTIFITYLEPETFPTLFEGFWWVMTTVTTVGYGDYSPLTTEGRLFAILLYIFGIGLIGVLIGKVVDWFSGLRKLTMEGKMAYKGNNHIVIIGWSQKASYAVDEILNSELKVDIVLIDQLEISPIIKDRVYFVQGNASKEETLSRANIQGAQSVLIFSDEKILDPLLSDGKTLIIASSVESMAEEVHTIVEIMDEDHIKNFEHVRVDEFLLSHDTISSLAVRSAFTKGISSLYTQLISRKYGDDLYQISKKEYWHSYRDAFNDLLKEGATLIADRDKLNINRQLDEEIPDNAKLFVICDRDTYEKIK